VPGARGWRPLWFVLHELVDQGLNIAVAKPSGLDSSGAVIMWEEQIPLPSLRDDEDFSVFPLDDGDEDAAAFDVPVTPRS
jgi:phage baseplate assembly protein W